jgi:hypothetical protein
MYCTYRCRYDQDEAYAFLKKHGMAVRAFGEWQPSASALPLHVLPRFLQSPTVLGSVQLLFLSW